MSHASATVNLPDGSTFPLRIFTPTPDARKDIAVLLVPGIAMGARYYDPFCVELTQQGFTVAAMELRGQGESDYVCARGSANAGYHEFATEDVPAALAVLKEQAGEFSAIHLVGHSMGGQLSLAYMARPECEVDGLISVASQVPYVLNYRPQTAARVTFGLSVVSIVLRLQGYVPQKVMGAFGDQPASRMRDWARFALRGIFAPDRADIDYTASLAQSRAGLLVIAIEGDIEAPPKAAKKILSLMSSSTRSAFVYIDEDLGHNRWARHPQRVTAEVVKWLGERAE